MSQLVKMSNIIGATVEIYTKEEAKKRNPEENLNTPFWDDFAGKKVKVEEERNGYLICSDQDVRYQVFHCDIVDVG